MTIRVIELFAGIGAQAAALERLGLDHECIAVAEIDERAYRGYCAIHGDVPNLGDVTKIEHLPECDLLTYSSPCTSISMAGKREGMEEGSGTASSLLWEVGRLLDDYKERGCLPEVLLMENVDAILFKANMPEFQRWLDKLEGMGYSNSYQVLNAKDYGVPQNRKRCFTVSTLTKGRLVFPAPIPLKIRMKDLLEKDVPESFYLSEERIATFERHKKRQEENGRGFGYKPRDPNGDSERERVSSSILTNADRYECTWLDETPKSEGQGEPGQINTVGYLPKYMMDRNGKVYGPDGVAPALLSRDAKGPVRIDVSDDAKVEVVGDLNNPHGCDATPKIEKPGLMLAGTMHNTNYDKMNRVYDPTGVCPVIETPTGGGGKCRKSSKRAMQRIPPRSSQGMMSEQRGSDVQRRKRCRIRDHR